MESGINKDFIFHHFAGKTSPMQRELIAQWLREKTNEEYYYGWLEEWEDRHPQYHANTELAWQQYGTFLQNNPHTGEAIDAMPLMTHQKHRSRWQWLIAASILCFLGVGSYLIRDQVIYHTYETAFGEIRSIQLPDGSMVLLNANSRLRLPRWGFGNSTREVLLTGEANFSITHMPGNQRFVVKTRKNFEVEVLGTEFTVFARKRESRVALNRGRVQLHYREGTISRRLDMKPGQLVTLNAKNHVALKTIKHPEVRPAWVEKRFVFDETPLREVAYMLEESYGLRIEIADPELGERVLIGSLRAENANQLLQSISDLLDINVIRQGNRVQLLNH